MSLVNRKVLTLDEFTIQQLREFPPCHWRTERACWRDMGLAAKRVNVEVNKAGLVDILGDAGAVNVQGEDVKKTRYICQQPVYGRAATRHQLRGASPVKNWMNTSPSTTR